MVCVIPACTELTDVPIAKTGPEATAPKPAGNPQGSNPGMGKTVPKAGGSPSKSPQEYSK